VVDDDRRRDNRRRLLVLVTLILALDTLLYGLVVPFLPGHATGLGLDGSEAGLLFATYALTQVVTIVAALRFAHRVRPAALLMGGVVGMGLSSVIFALAAESVPGLFVARAVQGVATVVWIAGPALVVARFPENERGRAIGLVLLGGSLGSLFGPPLGGVLYDIGGFATPFMAVVGLCALLLAVLRMHHGVFDTPDRPIAPRRSIGELIGLPNMVPTLVVVLVGASLLGLLELMLPLQLTAVLGSTPLENGLVFGAAVLGYGVTAPFSGIISDRMGRLHASTIGLVCVVPILIVFPLCTTWIGLIAVSATFGASIGFTLSPTMPAMADADDAAGGSKDYTAVYALHGLIYSGGLFLGPSLGSYLVDQTGLKATLFGLAAMSTLVAVFALAATRRAPAA